MGRSKRPTKDELVVMKKQGMTDKEIAALYGVSRTTITDWRRQYDIKADGSYWPPSKCGNPHCGKLVSEILRQGMCGACRKTYRRKGRYRTKAEMRQRNNGWCKRCGQERARKRGMCEPCWRYKHDNGKHRPWHLINREQCKRCERPHQPNQWSYGRCTTCHRYLQRHGVERPLKLIRKQAPHGWCDCGEPATHAGVELPVFTGEGNETAEKYNFCDLHYQWAMEDTPTKGEAVWNR